MEMRPEQIKAERRDPFLYQGVIAFIDGQIDTGTLRAGDRLPSLRQLSQRIEVSVPTVRQAYLELERLGRIEARPKSGYFVRPQSTAALVRGARMGAPVPVSCLELMDEVYNAMHQPGVLPLGVANPTMALPATKTLHRAMKRVMTSAVDRAIAYAPTDGESGLRRQLAIRYLNLGVQVDPDDLIITNGAQEALSLALQTVASPGDVIAVESPTYHGQLELIEAAGMLALEVETCPMTGVDVDALETALDAHPVAACMFSSAINNPLGSRMPNAARQRLVEMLEARNIPLIEDDVYGELVFDGDRPRPGQAFSKRGLVITCSSFSKTVAPGFRTGWIVPGRFRRQINKRKRAFSCATALLPQLALADFLGSGDFDRYVRRLVTVLRDNAQCMASTIARVFPEGTRLSRPQGGSVLWVEVPCTDSVDLFHRAIARNVSIVPGTIFAARNRYRSFLRLSFAHPWSERILDGLQIVGELAREASTRKKSPC